MIFGASSILGESLRYNLVFMLATKTKATFLWFFISSNYLFNMVFRFESCDNQIENLRISINVFNIVIK